MNSVMKTTLAFLIICFVFSSSLYSKNIDVLTSKDGVTINISSLQTLIEEPNHTFSLRINEPRYRVNALKSQYDIDELEFFIAVPNSDFHVELLKSEPYTVFSGDILPKYDSIITPEPIAASVTVGEIQEVKRVPAVRIALNPFDINPSNGTVIAYRHYTINIRFSVQLNQAKTTIYKKIDKLHSLFANQEHINSIIDYRKSIAADNSLKVKENTPLSVESWYDPAKTYVKIITTNDSIAHVYGKNIIEAEPSFSGTDVDYLHIYYFGKEEPCWIQDDDGALDNNTEIIFLSRHTFGDTTWLDYYTRETPFFLTSDNSQKGVRYTPFPDVSGDMANLDSVYVCRHYEDDVYWYWGWEGYGIETGRGERWVTTPIFAGGADSYSSNFTLMPLNFASSIKMSFYFVANEWTGALDKPYKMQLFINNDSVFEDLYPKESCFAMETDVSGKYLFNGTNSFKVKINLVYKDGSPVLPSSVFYDYLTTEGYEKPIAWQNKADFRVKQLNTNSNLEIKGFRGENVYAIDSLGKHFGKLPVEKGISYLANVKLLGSPLTSIIIDDSMYVSSKKNGIHICNSNGDDYSTFSYKYFSDYGADLNNYLSSINQYSFVVITVNSNQQPSNEFVLKLQSWGSSRAQELNNNAFVFSGIIGIQQSAAEDLQASGAASISNFIKTDKGKSYVAKLPLAAGNQYHIYAAEHSAFETAKVSKVNKTNLRALDKSAEAIFIYHPNFYESAKDYVEYRQSRDNITIDFVDVDDIYKEFRFGKKSPHAIKDYLRFAYDNWQQAPDYVVLYGDASLDARPVLSFTNYFDYIPAYGFAMSDYWYTMLGNDYQPYMTIGRLPVKSNEDGYIYLNKAKEYDSIQNNPWMKRFLFLTGGSDKSQINTFKSYQETNAIFVSSSGYCFDTIFITKTDEQSSSGVKGAEIREEINNGVGWINFFGHGAVGIYDLDGWMVQQLNNKSKYPILSTFSCNTGYFGEFTMNCRNEEYLFEPDKGTIASMGSTATGNSFDDYSLELKFSESLIDTSLHLERASDVMTTAKIKAIFYEPYNELSTVTQFAYLGDPLIKYRYSITPDLYFVPNEIKIYAAYSDSSFKSAAIKESDTNITIEGMIYNIGYNFDKNFNIQIVREFGTQTDTLYYLVNGLCNSAAFRATFPVLNMEGIHKFTIIADPFNTVNDNNISDNTAILYVHVLPNGLAKLDPQDNWNVYYKNPMFRIINPLTDDDTKSHDFSYKFSIYSGSAPNNSLVYESKENEIQIFDSHVDWLPEIQLENGKNYCLNASCYFSSGNDSLPALIVPFYTANEQIKSNPVSQEEINKVCSSFNMDGIEVFDNDGSTALRLEYKKYPYHLLGSRTDSLFDNIRNCVINFNNVQYVEVNNPWSVPNGINLLVISGEDGSFKALRNWYTFGSGDLRYDSTSVRMNRFLRDSVDSEDYIFMASCDVAFNLMEKHNEWHTFGSLDTMKMILKEYGSTLADSLSLLDSYFFVGKRGAIPGQYPEAVNWSGERVEVFDTIRIPVNSGTFSTGICGPAEKWQYLSIQADGFNNDVTYKAKLLGINANENRTDTLMDVKIGLNSLSEINADEYNYLKIAFDLQRTSRNVEPIINSINFVYEPSPELFISSSMNTSDTTLRGDTLETAFRIKNLSLRRDVDSTNLLTQIFAESTMISTELDTIGPIPINDSLSVVKKISTLNSSISNTISSKVNENPHKYELYTFNNKTSASFQLKEDNVPPEIEVFCDGIKIMDESYVSVQPLVEIRINDNSRLPITNKDNTIIRINSPIQTEANTKNYSFVSYGADIPLKAQFTFIPDSLDYRDNIFTVETMDATGNKAYSSIRVFVLQNGWLAGNVISPNPAADYTEIMFKLFASDQDYQGTIDIYNFSGQKIRTLKQNLRLGDNTIRWDLMDENGKSIPTGCYFYRISAIGTSWIESISGNFVVLK
jgi:hypothetical protein